MWQHEVRVQVGEHTVDKSEVRCLDMLQVEVHCEGICERGNMRSLIPTIEMNMCLLIL